MKYVFLGFTSKQASVLQVILRGNTDATFVDLDQLLQRVDYKTTKQSMQFTIRALRDRGYIRRSENTEFRRGRYRRLLQPTTEAYEDYKKFLGDL